MTIDDLVEVEPFLEDGGYRQCELCYETCCEDIWAGRKWRKFYNATDGSELDVCENCVEAFRESERKLDGH